MPVLMQKPRANKSSFVELLLPCHPVRVPFLVSEPSYCKVDGASDGTRTHDLLITNQGLYQLSYTGFPRRWRPIRTVNDACQR
jgi:hypothetical protein